MNILFQVTINSDSRKTWVVLMQSSQLDLLLIILVNRNSTVNICSLDVAKAFDRINHFTLFLQLMKKSVPVNIVIMLASWYTNSTGIVNWNGALSPSYHLSAGVRQGRVISPVIFANYVDGIISAIQFKGAGVSYRLEMHGNFYVC